MKIAVNVRLLLPNKLEGIGWFTYELFKRITENHPEVTFYFFFDRAYDEQFVFGPNVIPIVLAPQARHPILFWWWFEKAVAHKLKELQPDVFVSPDGYLSLRSATPQLSVIHDINFEHFPQFVPLGARMYLRYYFPLFAKKATRIATVSAFSKQEISSIYHQPESKIDVIPNAAADRFKPIAQKKQDTIRNTYSENAPFFIYVGALQPRKNILGLLRAFEHFKTQHGTNHKLLLTGEKKWWSKEQAAQYKSMHHKSDVIFTGRLNAEELPDVLAAAEALTYVSTYEGFGIPILEAMQCGTPVITSNCSSMPEVAGNAALLVNPNNPTSIADAMAQVTSNYDLRVSLSKKGIERASQFSWNKSSELLWECILKTRAHA